MKKLVLTVFIKSIMTLNYLQLFLPPL